MGEGGIGGASDIVAKWRVLKKIPGQLEVPFLILFTLGSMKAAHRHADGRADGHGLAWGEQGARKSAPKQSRVPKSKSWHDTLIAPTTNLCPFDACVYLCVCHPSRNAMFIVWLSSLISTSRFYPHLCVYRISTYMPREAWSSGTCIQQRSNILLRPNYYGMQPKYPPPWHMTQRRYLTCNSTRHQEKDAGTMQRLITQHYLTPRLTVHCLE